MFVRVSNRKTIPHKTLSYLLTYFYPQTSSYILETHLFYELACVMQNKTCQEQGAPSELHRAVNVPDWKVCSTICWARPQCLGGWQYYVKEKLCILYRTCTAIPSSDKNKLLGDRNCHATRKY